MQSRAASVARNATVDAPVSTTSSNTRPSTRACARKCPSLPGERVTVRELDAPVGESAGAAAIAEGEEGVNTLRSAQRAIRTPAANTATAKVTSLPMIAPPFESAQSSFQAHKAFLTR